MVVPPATRSLKNGAPCFWRGRFKAEAGVDTFLDMDGWKKGFVFINGFNIGGYWSIGAERTLYVPGELLHENNIIEIFEIHTPNVMRSVKCIDHSMLCEMPIDSDEADFCCCNDLSAILARRSHRLI